MYPNNSKIMENNKDEIKCKHDRNVMKRKSWNITSALLKKTSATDKAMFARIAR